MDAVYQHFGSFNALTGMSTAKHRSILQTEWATTVFTAYSSEEFTWCGFRLTMVRRVAILRVSYTVRTPWFNLRQVAASRRQSRLYRSLLVAGCFQIGIFNFISSLMANPVNLRLYFRGASIIRLTSSGSGVLWEIGMGLKLVSMCFLRQILGRSTRLVVRHSSSFGLLPIHLFLRIVYKPSIPSCIRKNQNCPIVKGQL